MLKPIPDDQKKFVIIIGIIVGIFVVTMIAMPVYFRIMMDVNWRNSRADSMGFIHGPAMNHDEVMNAIGKRHGVYGWMAASKKRAFWEYSITPDKSAYPEDDGDYLSSEESQIMLLSFKLFSVRRDMQDVLYGDKNVSWWLTGVVMTLGAAATISVGINGILKNSVASVFAVALSAISTLSANFLSYSGVQGEFDADKRQYAALSKLHDEMVFSVASYSDKSVAIDKNVVATWVSRYLSIRESKDSQGVSSPKGGADNKDGQR